MPGIFSLWGLHTKNSQLLVRLPEKQLHSQVRNQTVWCHFFNGLYKIKMEDEFTPNLMGLKKKIVPSFFFPLTFQMTCLSATTAKKLFICYFYVVSYYNNTDHLFIMKLVLWKTGNFHPTIYHSKVCFL